VPYDIWKKVWFDDEEQKNPAVSGRWVTNGNPSGQMNFTVYALSGGDPQQEGASILPVGSIIYDEGEEYFSLSAQRYPLAQAAYSVQVSGDLNTWHSDPAAVTAIIDEPGFLEVRPNTPMSLTNRQFLRLRIHEP